MPGLNCPHCVHAIHRHWLSLFAVVILFAGCVAIPVRMSPQVQGRAGVSADHTFIKEGQTNREEVMQRLGWADSGLKENRLFWGRWVVSTSGTLLLIAVPGAVGGERERKWRPQNSLIEFDERDIVIRVVPKVEDKDIVRELVAWSQRTGYRPANPSSIRNSFSAWTEGLHRHRGSMAVNTDSLDFFEGRIHFNVPHDKIVSLESGSYHRYTLKLKNNTPWGKKIYLGIGSDELLPILAYITPNNP